MFHCPHTERRTVAGQDGTKRKPAKEETPPASGNLPQRLPLCSSSVIINLDWVNNCKVAGEAHTFIALRPSPAGTVRWMETVRLEGTDSCPGCYWTVDGLPHLWSLLKFQNFSSRTNNFTGAEERPADSKVCSSSVSRHSESSPKLLLHHNGQRTSVELLLWQMFCKHHLNPQSTRGLKLREVNLSHSNKTQRQALIHSRVCPCSHHTHVRLHHMDPHALVWCSRTLRAMKTSEQEADKLSNGKSSQSWSEGKTGNPYNAWWALSQYILGNATLSHSTQLFQTISRHLLPPWWKSCSTQSERSPTCDLPLLLGRGKSRGTEKTMGVKVVPPQNKSKHTKEW